MEPLVVDVQQLPQALVIKIRGEVRLDAKPLETAFMRAAAMQAKAVILEMSGLTFISSLGMGSIVSLRNGLRRAGGKVYACGTRPIIWDALTRARLNELFAGAYGTLAETVAHI